MRFSQLLHSNSAENSKWLLTSSVRLEQIQSLVCLHVFSLVPGVAGVCTRGELRANEQIYEVQGEEKAAVAKQRFGLAHPLNMCTLCNVTHVLQHERHSSGNAY